MKKIIISLVFLSIAQITIGQTLQELKKQNELLISRIEKLEQANNKQNLLKGFELGVYGETVYSRRFYSNSWQRYSQPDMYKNDKGHGQVDMPHFVTMMNYDFGKGWKFCSELEFEHGGVGAAVEIEAEETGEYESEIEKGGEFVVEQMWIEKSFATALNLKLGHIVVPMGGVNAHHTPIEFFGNYRPEGPRTMLPCTWHQTGISLWGKTTNWKYEAQLLPGLDAFMFDDNYWIGKGATSTFEFKVANSFAGMLRIDNYSIKNLQLGISGYIGKSGNNSLKQKNYENIQGLVGLMSFDFRYMSDNVAFRGSADYGTLTNSEEITQANIRNRKDSPSPKDKVAKSAASLWAEAGYNIFGFFPALKDQKLFIFGRYNYYDTMLETESTIFDDKRFKRNCYAAGINYYPIKEIVIKAEYATRMFDSPYNTEPSVNIGIAFTGFLIKNKKNI